MQCSPIECAGSFLVRECGDVEIVSYQPVLSCNLRVNVCVGVCVCVGVHVWGVCV